MTTFIKALQDKLKVLEAKAQQLAENNYLLQLECKKAGLLNENYRLRRTINERAQYSTAFPYPEGLAVIDYSENPFYYSQGPGGPQTPGTIYGTSIPQIISNSLRNPILAAPVEPVSPTDPSYGLHNQASQIILQFAQSLFKLLNSMPQGSGNPMFPGPLNGDSNYINNFVIPQINNALNSGPNGGVNYPALLGIINQLEQQFPGNGFGNYANQIQGIYNQIMSL
jgi:hypothetical protein